MDEIYIDIGLYKQISMDESVRVYREEIFGYLMDMMLLWIMFMTPFYWDALFFMAPFIWDALDLWNSWFTYLV